MMMKLQLASKKPRGADVATICQSAGVATGWTCNDAYEEEGRIRRVGVDEGDLEAAVVNRKPTDDGEHDGLESQSLIEDEQHHRPLYPIDEGLPTGPRTGDYAFTVAGIRMQRTDKANLGWKNKSKDVNSNGQRRRLERERATRTDERGWSESSNFQRQPIAMFRDELSEMEPRRVKDGTGRGGMMIMTDVMVWKSMGGEQEKEHRNMREREGRAVLVTKERQGINPEDVQGPKRDARGGTGTELLDGRKQTWTGDFEAVLDLTALSLSKSAKSQHGRGKKDESEENENVHKRRNGGQNRREGGGERARHLVLTPWKDRKKDDEAIEASS
ncbi:hypothetical protein K443DRAFT_125862 [Laccaria amethystina LaAM-08-1]|uniref:Uncharacterized protein n=1 Tax=Laccaria amethystina LaAM-08-1 TaxID=1095629 RepID=A0A0C9X4R6_9AGAR|nr:hypothetical protein K443DRAFT_125862 [Laccaria amethystina LaAM-08-1]